MLDKFRNDYIIHFYGAVFIPNKICMVTEFAQYGSLQDLMKIGHIGINKTLMIKNEIKARLNKEGYIIPYNVVPMKEVVNYLDIDIDYLEKMKQYEKQ